MSSEGVPFFKASELDGAADVLHERLETHPLDDLFPTVVHDGEYVEVDVKKWKTYAADPVDFGQPTPYADPHEFRTVRAKPLQLREARPLSNKEIAFFRRYGQLRQSAGLTESHETKRGEILSELSRETMMPVEERKHIMQCEALRGTVTLNIGGQTVNTPYGLTALTAPSTTWDNTGSADPVVDVYSMKDEFLTNSEVEADTVIFDRRLFSNYLAPNAAWNEIMKRNPDMAAAFVGAAGRDGDIRAWATPRRPFMMFDMLWIPVSGRYLNAAGSAVDRWPVNQLAVLALDAGDGQRVLEWASTRDEYCPDGQPRFRTLTNANPISYETEYALNGIPMIRIKERCQTWQVAP